LAIPLRGKTWSHAEMSRTVARFTQVDLNRAIRAAKQAGAASVLLLPDGSIRIELEPRENETTRRPSHEDDPPRPKLDAAKD
jgi:hypothetical protein